MRYLVIKLISTLVIFNNSENEKVWGVDLKPGVLEIIKGTYLEHACCYPDPNEEQEVLRVTLSVDDMYLDDPGVFYNLTNKYPESRYAHLGLSNALYEQYQFHGIREMLNLSLKAMIKASEIGLSYGNILYLQGIKDRAVELGEPEIAKNWFEQISKKYPNDLRLKNILAELS